MKEDFKDERNINWLNYINILPTRITKHLIVTLVSRVIYNEMLK